MRGDQRLRGTTWELVVYDRRAKKNVSESLPGRAGRARSEREANSALAKLVARVEDSERAANAKKKRFDALVEEWLQRKGSGKPGRAAFEQYEWIVRTKLVPTFGKERTDNIRHESIQNFYNRLLETYSERTVRHVHSVLRQVLAYARKRGYRSDYALEDIELPEPPDAIEAPDVEEAHGGCERVRSRLAGSRAPDGLDAF